MNRDTKENRSFEESIRNIASDAQLTPSTELWERIAASVESDAAAANSLRSSILRWGSAVAASILIAVAATMWFDSQQSAIEEQEAILVAKIAKFEPIPASRIELPAVDISLPKVHVVSTKESTANEPKAKKRGKGKSSSEQQSTTPSVTETPATAATPAYSAKSSELTNSSTSQYTSPRSSKPLAVALLAGGGSTSASGVIATPPRDMYNSMSPLKIPSSSSAELISEYKNATDEINHYSPITVAVSLTYGLSELLSVESGLDYNYLRSEITSSKSGENTKQVLQFLGIPLRLNYKIYSTDHIQLYSGIGGQIERCISAQIDSNSVAEEPWHYSADALLGAQYNLNTWLGLYLEPEVAYYFTPTSLTSIRTEHPVSFNLRFGVRFWLGQK